MIKENFGWLYKKKQGMASCKKLLEETFSMVEVVVKNKGYYILKAVK